MWARSPYRGKLFWVLGWVAPLGCGEPHGPYPTVTLSIRGQVFTTAPIPVAVAGATVALREFKGLLTNPQTLAKTTTDQAGRYQVIYSFTSVCSPHDNTTNWIEASAEGYATASSFTTEEGQYSDPPIYCTSEPQVIDLSMEPIAVNTLIFTRADQSQIAFASDPLVFVWCGPWEEGVVPIATPSLQILFRGPSFAADPRWHLRVVVADVIPGQPLTFPNEFVFDQPKDVDLFVSDPPNELSTQAGGSSGSVTFQKLRCGAGGVVRLSIDALIGSEFGDGPPVRVTGSFSAAVGQPPG